MKFFDGKLWLILIFFWGLGLIQVYSSSFVYAVDQYQNGQFFFLRQFQYTLAVIPLVFLVALIPWWIWRDYFWTAWLVGLALLAATLTPQFGVAVGGAQRWLQLPGPLRFEPAELVKLSLPFVCARLLVNWQSRRPLWSEQHALLLSFILVGLCFYRQPDFGSLVICGAVILAAVVAFGVAWRWLVLASTLAATAGYFAVINVGYRSARLQAFLDPWADPSDRGFQILQSLSSFSQGGLLGVGLGQGQGKLFFLPEAHNDFTVAVLGEEWGFVGFFIVVLLYGFLVLRCFQVSLAAEDLASRLIGLGLTVLLGLSVLINLGVVLGLLPTKGLTLPFLSYGGSSLFASSILVAFILSLDRNRRLNEARKFRGFKFSRSFQSLG